MGVWGDANLNRDRNRNGDPRLGVQSGPEREEGVSAEEKLDALLGSLIRQESGKRGEGREGEKASPLEVLRRQMREELIPAFDEIRKKYESLGISMTMDASDFLDGGRHITLEFAREPYIIRLEGAVTDRAIGFNEVHSTRLVEGTIKSGPMLMTRRLSVEQFREFVFERVAILIKSVLAANRAVSLASPSG